MSVTAIRAAAVIAAIYGYFLIFAQFSFLELLRAGGANLMEEKVALGSMAAAGIASGFFAAWRGVSPAMMRIALGVAALASLLAPLEKAMPSTVGIAVATGCALGVATVSLAALVPAWCSVTWIGLGTGLGYACCNLPLVFMQGPSEQAWIATGFAIIGLLVVPSAAGEIKRDTNKIFPTWGALALFTALVWLDSAAFFVIQHTESLKFVTWGESLLWRNAALHFSFAILAGIWLARGGARALPILAWVILAVAALAVNVEPTQHFAGWLYPAGVSIYSAALVAWPGSFSGANSTRQAAWQAAWLFAIAGWFGSANGIGMAQTMQRIPAEFVIGSGVVVIAVLVLNNLKHWRSAIAVAVIFGVALMTHKTETVASSNAVERGHQVYLAEGCIHCHSQYVRPGSLDEENWGPVRNVEEVLKGKPVLIGNRRQGPDLTNVGVRRSDTWLKLHFINPQAFAADSAMPSYAHLFESGKGDDLVIYLSQSRATGIGAVMVAASKWQPEGTPYGQDGAKLFAANCSACHGADGQGNGPISLELVRKPSNLVSGPFAWTPAGDGLELRLARVIKFGLPGTDMPGHEALIDAQVLALRDYILKLRTEP